MMEDHSSGKDESGSSVSRSSSVSSAAARARATAEAARARVTFSQKELELKKLSAKLDLEKATLEADLEALELEKAAAAANAEAEVLEAAAGRACEDVQSARSGISPQTIRQQTEAYLQHQAQENIDNTKQPDTSLPLTLKDEPTKPRQTQWTEYLTASGKQRCMQEHPITHPLSSNKANQRQDSSSVRHVSHPSYLQKNNMHDPTITPSANMVDFAKYLARRELVTTGLNKFDDRPESFRAWQSSFLNATQGLELTASEELDLLVKWLGKESSEHIRRIRAVHITNPQAALQLCWSRLQECYAAPEVIEDALFKRLDRFPHLSSKENIKLRELSDLLMELLSAKEDGYLPGLSYLDSPRGIKTIVEKLPPNLQEKWLSAGSNYKENYGVCFPPFTFFTDFVHKQAKARNDPSFALTESSRTQYRSERLIARQDGMKAAISVHKTDVSTTSEPSSRYRAPTTKNVNVNYDEANYCPLHNKPHPLEKCRTFKMKPLAERKDVLREHRRCFRCCSPTHMARECTVELNCNECQSNRHVTAMHPETTFSLAMSTRVESDVEQQSREPPEVTSKCTEVCGEGPHARSCAKISLVRVFPKGQREHSVKMYAILDDQSNRSLARSEFFQHFGIQGGLSPYLMRTCAGTTEMVGRKAAGFQVEAMNGEVCFDLPPLIECNEIMSNRTEIPTPEVALFHPHLKSVAPHIPQLDSEAQILILLGRDLICAHKVRDQINGPHNAPFAQRLDLGWVIVGEVCIESVHKPTVAVFKTNVLQNGRPSFLTSCENYIRVKEKLSHGGEQILPPEDKLGMGVFINTKNDNKPALSFEDEIFLETMQKEFHRDNQNSWVAPLPFKSPRA
ncbi:uncharacterized protein LOC119194889 [Pungitius pungitius]|uniref:uncharacterized protein LOC119194889 n=1 Tax=Pungitius pungitius TaxID=134920 RepID=UPI002E153C43